MIVRILEDGQYEVTDKTVKRLESLDLELDAALQSGNQSRFDHVLKSIEAEIHEHGRRLDASDIVPSDLTLPHHDATIDELTRLLASEPVDKS